MFRLAHITDVHIKYNTPEPNLSVFRALLKDALAEGCDHILLTGDISDYCDNRDFTIVRELLTEFKLLDSDRLSVVPGNHDIFGGPNPNLPFFLYPTHCKELDYDAYFSLFALAMAETFSNTITDGDSIFPYIKILNDNIAVICLNSIARYSKDLNPMGTNGLIDDLQMKSLENISQQTDIKDKLKIVLIHHHFNKPGHNKAHPEHGTWLESEQWKMRLHDKEELYKYFDKYNIDLVLHGHTHITDTYKMNNNFFVNSSGCSIPFTISGEKEYHIIETEPGNKFNIVKRRIDT